MMLTNQDFHLLPELLDGVLLRQSDGPVLQGGEDGRGDVHVVWGANNADVEKERNLQLLTLTCQDIGGPADPPGEQLAGLDRHGGQLGLVVQHVADGVDRVHVGPLGRVVQHLLVLGVQLEPHVLEADVGGAGVPPDGKDDGVELVGEVGAVVVLGVDPNLEARIGSHTRYWQSSKHLLYEYSKVLKLFPSPN